MGRLEVGTECGSHRRQQGAYVAISQVQRVTTARCGNSNSTHMRPPLRVLRRLPQRQRRPLPVAPPPPMPTPPVAVQTRRQSSRSTKGQRLLPTQYRGSGLAPPHHKPAGDCLASGDSDDETDEFTLDAAAVVAEEALERKEGRRVKPWLSELDVPEW
jgi:hypothetical protein